MSEPTIYTGWRCSGCGARELTPEVAPDSFESWPDCTCPHSEPTLMPWVDVLEAHREERIRAARHLGFRTGLRSRAAILGLWLSGMGMGLLIAGWLIGLGLCLLASAIVFAARRELGDA